MTQNPIGTQVPGSPAGPNTSPDQILRFFRHAHLPPALARVSREFAAMAAKVVLLCPAGPERTASLRDLLKSKDGAVRACVPDDPKFILEWAAEIAAAQFELDQHLAGTTGTP